ncbi:MAG TPA: translocation/assembly module TamB domain-containing protein [Nevskiaceae bacterium]
MVTWRKAGRVLRWAAHTIARSMSHFSGALVLFAMLVAIVAAFLLGTTPGLRLLVDVGERVGTRALTVAQVHGSAFGGWVATGVAWHGQDGLRFTAERVALQWTPSALLHGQVVVRHLALDGVRVTLPPSKPSRGGPPPSPHLPQHLPLGVRIAALDIHDLRVVPAEGRPLEVTTVHLQASWIGDALKVERLAVSSPGTGPVQLTAAAVTGRNRLQLTALEVSGPGQLRARGTIGYGGAASDLQLELEGFGWPLTGPDRAKRVSALQGRVRLDGGLDRYRFDAELQAHARDHALSLTLKGSGTPDAVTLAALDLRADRTGRVDGSGTVTLRPTPAADLALTVSRFDPAALLAGWPGEVNAKLQLKTHADNGVQQIQLEAQVTRSKLRGLPLQANAVGTASVAPQAGWKVNVERLDATLGATELQLAGRATPPFDLRGRVDSPDLARLDPKLGGRLQADFRLAGTLAAPVLQSRGQGTGLRFAGTRIALARWDIQIDTPKESRVHATLGGIKRGELAMADLELTGSGTAARHSLQLDARSARGSAELRLAGTYDVSRQAWSGQLTALEIAPRGLRAWRLTAPAALQLARSRASLASTCLSNGSGVLCLDASSGRGEAQGNFTLRDLQLAAFQVLLPADVTVAGALGGHGQFTWKKRRLVGDALLEMASGHVAVRGAGSLELRPSRITLSAQPDGLQLHADLQTSAGTIDAQAVAAGAGIGNDLARAPLSGSLAMSVPDIAVLQPFAAQQVSDLHGSVSGQLHLGGTVGAPQIDGQLALRAGRATVPAAGITVTDVELALAGGGDAPLNVRGSARSGGGTMDLSGTIDPRRWPVTAALRVTGHDFQAVDTADARVWISPDLQLARTTGGFDVTGRLLVPRAQITPRGGLMVDHGVGVSPDQVIVGAPASKPVPEPAVNVQLGLILGDDVHFEGYGLKARVAGGLVIDQKPHGPALARGQLHLVDGRFKAYGQDLTIANGRLIFDGGPVTQPAVDVLAVRKPRADIEVGVQVRGTIAKPELTLTSTPAMSRQEQLSWLLYGQPLDRSAGSEQGAVLAAAMSLGLGGSNLLAGQLGSRLGLDDVTLGASSGGGSAVTTNASAISGSAASQGFGANPAQAAQLTLGKYLTPRLYVSFGVGLFQPGQVFRLLYTLGHGFQVQTESGVTNGGDLLYSFEAGK